nr:type II toxin-antitoxin system PemK/MazF family toxin [Methylosinus sp. PW1]
MSTPKPVQGLVIRYAYLWRAEHQRGREEGVKDRPCAVVLATTTEDGEDVVTVLPITHSPPADSLFAVELPTATKKRLRLDGERSWVVLSEANRFVWPGPDLRPLPNAGAGSAVLGLLPYKFAEELRLRLLAHIKARRAHIVPRTE